MYRALVPGMAPFRKHDSDAGLDLPVAERTVIWPHSTVKVPTGLAFALPGNTWGDIRPRSSATIAGLAVSGVVDESYRGQVFVLATNNTTERITVNVGDRIAQMIVMAREDVQLEAIDVLPGGERGSSGFGSSGGTV